MKRLWAVLLAMLLVLLSACGRQEQELPPMQEEPEVPDQMEEREPPSPLELLDVMDTDVEYAVVPAETEPLFRYGLEGLDAQWYLVGEAIAVYSQQDMVMLLDKSGHTITYYEVLGKSAQFSRNHFAIIDEEGAVIYDQTGREQFRISAEGLNGLIQIVEVSADGTVAAFTCEDVDSFNYEIHIYDVASGRSRIVTSAQSGVVSYSYWLSGISDDGKYVYGEGDTTDEPYTMPAMVVCDTGTAEVVEVIPCDVEEYGEVYRIPFRAGTASGYLLHAEDSYQMQMGLPAVWGDILYNAEPGMHSGQFYQLDPVIMTGKVGYFPLYNYEVIGMEGDGNVLIRYFYEGDCVIARVTLREGEGQKPLEQVDLSLEKLDTVLGQRLNHRGGGQGTYRLLSAVVTKYTDTFGDTQFTISGEVPDLADRLFNAVLFMNYGSGGLPERLGPFEDDEGVYRIPLQEGYAWTERMFGPLLEGIELDLRNHGLYNAQTETLDYFGGYGWGQSDYVYLESASCENNLLDLTAVVIPFDYLYRGDGIARVRITALYDMQADTFTYQSAQLLEHRVGG